jgi:3-methyl-2-oxobutanoate hydroxymethyltransferase
MMAGGISFLVMKDSAKTTLSDLIASKRQGQKFPVLTCYDFTTARLMADAGIEVILVGDTYGEVCLGHASTLPVKLDHLLTITEAVRRGAPNAYLIGDMPYMSYQVSKQQAVRNAGRFMAEAGCDCVKVEVNRALRKTVEAMSNASIPVMAHLGLRPQAIHTYGGYKAQGKRAATARLLIEDAALMVKAGAVALLLEAIPNEVAEIITEQVSVPVIGCVAGPHCDGTVVVLHDMLGYGAGHPPRSVKRYANLHRVLTDAFREYVSDVTERRYPDVEHGIAMPPGESEQLHKLFKTGAEQEV